MSRRFETKFRSTLSVNETRVTMQLSSLAVQLCWCSSLSNVAQKFLIYTGFTAVLREQMFDERNKSGANDYERAYAARRRLNWDKLRQENMRARTLHK